MKGLITEEDVMQKFTQEEIKNGLMLLGVKAGGRPEERAKRLWSLREYLDNLDSIPKNLMAKKVEVISTYN